MRRQAPKTQFMQPWRTPRGAEHALAANLRPAEGAFASTWYTPCTQQSLRAFQSFDVLCLDCTARDTA